MSSIDFLTQIDVLTNNVQNMVTSHKYAKLVQSCKNLNVQLQNLILMLSLPYPNYCTTKYYKYWTVLMTFNICKSTAYMVYTNVVQYSYQHSVGLEKKKYTLGLNFCIGNIFKLQYC